MFYIYHIVDGQWSKWGTWSSCTKTCGHGISTRERMCGNSHPAFGGVTCDGKPFEAEVCLVQTCPGTIVYQCVMDELNVQSVLNNVYGQLLKTFYFKLLKWNRIFRFEY